MSEPIQLVIGRSFLEKRKSRLVKSVADFNVAKVFYSQHFPSCGAAGNVLSIPEPLHEVPRQKQSL